MKKIILSIVLSASFLIGHVSLVSADNVAVQGNLALIANGGLIAKDIVSGDPNACFAGGHFAPDGVTDVSDLLATSTDVAIIGNNAVVTYDVVVDDVVAGIDIVTVDITSCLSISDVIVDVEACISTVNLEEGELTIPCVEIDGNTFTVEMERRGNSDNWEVSFFGDSPVFSHHHDDDEDDDEDDEDDS